jgi:hypothetical protein
MTSECCECDRAAIAYHGPYAYCAVCLTVARRLEPDAHRCVRCHAEQPRNVSWHRNAPCGSCQEMESPARRQP